MKLASNIVWGVMENHGYSQVKDLPSHQFLQEHGAVFSNYFAITHPSGPNYRALACGDTVCPGEEYRQQFPNIASEILRLYRQRTSVFNLNGSPIAARHNPYQDTCAEVESITLPDNNLAKFIDSNPREHFYIGWDDNNNAHSGPLDLADKNLSQVLDSLDHSTWFNTSINGLYPVFMFVWDEDLSDALTNQVFCSFYGQGIKPGIYHNRYNHYDFFATLAQIYELDRKKGQPMIEAFKA